MDKNILTVLDLPSSIIYYKELHQQQPSTSEWHRTLPDSSMTVADLTEWFNINQQVSCF